ncbi:MAG: DUF1974 domain-containing protein, partial [Verrucomicrobia bacterium]|nr:DUF1974 domain-containing protein [Verrucomicrobiota bacterium]
GSRKRREMVSGRLADALSWLYLASTTLKRFHDDGQQPRDVAVMRWATELAMLRIDEALRGVLDNLPNRFLSVSLGWIVFGFAGRARAPSDRLSGKVAQAILGGGALRDHLTSDIYIPPAQEEGLGQLEATLQKIIAAQSIRTKFRESAQTGKHGADFEEGLDKAIEAGVITSDERDQLLGAEQARLDIIQVDVFEPDTYRELR